MCALCNSVGKEVFRQAQLMHRSPRDTADREGQEISGDLERGEDRVAAAYYLTVTWSGDFCRMCD